MVGSKNSPLRELSPPEHRGAPAHKRDLLHRSARDKKYLDPIVVVESHSKFTKANNRPKNEAAASATTSAELRSSLVQFHQTELGANFSKLFQNKKLPFKYRTLVCLQKILFCREVEEDIQKFRAKESKIRRNWKFEDKMTSDIARTPILKDAPRLHVDAKRIVEFYCWSHNVHYCQGMLEVLLPFLFMKSNEGASTEPPNGQAIHEEEDPLN